MARVLMTLSNAYTNDARVRSEVRSLTAAGHDVTVLAWDREGSAPPRETMDGGRIVRFPSSFAMRGTPVEILKLPGLWRLTYRAGLGSGAYDVVHAHDFDTLPSAMLLKSGWHVPLVYDSHEMFAELVAQSRARLLKRTFESAERLALRRADEALAASPGVAAYLRRLGCARVSVLMNCRDPPSKTYAPPSNERMRIVYVGGLERARSLLVSLADLAAEEPGIEARVFGRGPLESRLRDLASTNPRGAFAFSGYLPLDRVIPETQAADVVFSAFDPRPANNALGGPNKLFEALACGRPVIVTAGTWAAEVVEESDCGLAIEYSREGLRKALVSLRDDPALRERLGRNALRAALARFNWTAQESVLLDVYDRVLRSRGQR